MTKTNSFPDAIPQEINNGTIDITIDDTCLTAAVAAQTELIDMLARLVLHSIENETQMASPQKRSHDQQAMP